jgi:hypothetical protein
VLVAIVLGLGFFLNGHPQEDPTDHLEESTPAAQPAPSQPPPAEKPPVLDR